MEAGSHLILNMWTLWLFGARASRIGWAMAAILAFYLICGPRGFGWLTSLFKPSSRSYPALGPRPAQIAGILGCFHAPVSAGADRRDRPDPVHFRYSSKSMRFVFNRSLVPASAVPVHDGGCCCCHPPAETVRVVGSCRRIPGGVHAWALSWSGPGNATAPITRTRVCSASITDGADMSGFGCHCHREDFHVDG